MFVIDAVALLKQISVLFAIITLCHGGIISHGHGQATSYQHVKIENYHPVPVYLKKEHSHLLEHPVAAGHTATSLQIHHGGEHDHGYATNSGTHQQFHGQDLGGYEHQGDEQQLGGGQEYGEQQYEGHQQYEGQQQYEGHQQYQQVDVAAQEQQHEGAGGADLGHYDAGADLAGHGLQAYATQDADYGHVGQEAGGYEQEAAGYEQAVDDTHHQGHY